MAVATPVSKGHKPIQVRADVLRHWEMPLDAMRGFAMLPNDPTPDPQVDQPPSAVDWRDADLKRAIAAAEEAGLKNYRAEVAPDGTISIIVGEAGSD